MTKSKNNDKGFEIYKTETHMVKASVTIEQRWTNLSDTKREFYNEQAKSKK